MGSGGPDAIGGLAARKHALANEAFPPAAAMLKRAALAARAEDVKAARRDVERMGRTLMPGRVEELIAIERDRRFALAEARARRPDFSRLDAHYARAAARPAPPFASIEVLASAGHPLNPDPGA